MGRSRLRRKIDVLKVLDDEPVIVNRISGIANINYVELTSMLFEMEKKGLVTLEVIGKKARPYKRLVYQTDKGSKAVRAYEYLLEKLGETQ
jgi:predicted transcriptional regulator